MKVTLFSARFKGGSKGVMRRPKGGLPPCLAFLRSGFKENQIRCSASCGAKGHRSRLRFDGRGRNSKLTLHHTMIDFAVPIFSSLCRLPLCGWRSFRSRRLVDNRFPPDVEMGRWSSAVGDHRHTTDTSPRGDSCHHDRGAAQPRIFHLKWQESRPEVGGVFYAEAMLGV